MNIRPRNIKKYDGGGYFDNLNNDYFNWYNRIWKENARILGNLPLSQGTDRWGKPTGYDIHHQTDDLRGAAWSNYNYTLASNKDNVRNDILYYLDNSGVNYTSPEDFVSKYNDNIDNIFNKQNRLYNYSMKDTSWTPFNRNYNLTYHSKGTGEGLSTILYDPTTEQYRGTSTHARRPDLYEKNFKDLTDDEKWDRIHKIKLNGKDIYVAKESNGHLILLPNIATEEDIKLDSAAVKDPEKEKEGSLTPEEKADPESLWNKLGTGLKNVAPDLLDTLRLAGNMINNQRVYDESMKAIKPNLLQSYHTYRQVVGDEATKLAYYRRAVQGELKAALPFTAEADKQVAYMNEAKRIGDESRAQGDLVDNQKVRETSAESSAHTDSNKERDTAVANSNITEMNKADAAKHQLTAQKYSADWTNLEQYLMGKLYKLEKNKAELRELADKIWLLTEQNKLENDPTFISLQKAVDEAWTKASKDGKVSPENDENVKKAILNLRNWKTRLEIIMLLSKPTYTYSAKQGTKLEKKTKDESLKYLYKTSRDIVEHFRKMSKMTDDSRIKTLPKAIKLPTHPRKMQLGGVAPFTIYRPLGLGGESAVSSQTTSSGSGKSEKDEAGKNKLDMIKELFKAIQGQGLPIDVSLAYREISNTLNKAKALGKEMTTDDIASMYLKSMDTISRLKHSKEVYEKAEAVATLRESLDEFAVDALGNYVVQDEDNNITTVKSLEEIKEQGLNPITNLLLLNLRAYSPNLALQQGDYFISNIINNGMGINKIGALIKALAGDIGTLETKLDGLTLVESNKVKSGLQILANAPDGYYKHTVENKNQLELIKAALSYIENMLSPSQKAILNIHGGVKENIAKFLSSLMDFSENISIQPLTGKASDKDKDSLDKLSSNPLLAMLREIGGSPINYSIVTRDSNTKMSVNGTAYPALPGIKNDMSIDAMLSISGFDSVVLSKAGITFGDLQIDPNNLKDIMYANSGRNAIVTLPCKIVNGVKQVNLAVRDAYEKAESEAANTTVKGSAEYYRILGKKLKEAHLDSLLDSNGLPNKNMFAQFLIVEGYTSDKVPFDNKNSQYIEKVQNPTLDLEDRISTALSTDNEKSNYSLDIKDKLALFELTYNDIYRGTVFIPLNNNPNAALFNDKLNVKQSQELEELYLISNKSINYNKNNSY